jgi:hypothetical protein
MVIMKVRHEPGTEEATLSVRLTTATPTLSRSALQSSSVPQTSETPQTSTSPALRLQIHIRPTQSTNPSRPLTFCTSGTMLDTARPEHGHLDFLALGSAGPGLVCTKPDGSRKVISLGNFRVHRARQEGTDAVNLLDRPDTGFVSVPSLESGEELVLNHELSAERLFAYSEHVTPADLEIGETYRLSMEEDYIGTMWWCWGDLEGDLKGKKLHCFSEGFCIAGSEERPSEEEMQREGWITGEDVSKLVFEFEEGRNAWMVEVGE